METKLNLYFHIFWLPVVHLVVFFTMAFIFLTGCATSDIQENSLPLPAHHDGNGFKNIYANPHHGFGTFIKWRFGLGPDEKAPVPPDSLEPYRPQSVKVDTFKIQHPDINKIQITWIGHSSFLIQVMGRNILTDPVFSKRVSPVSFLGPKRQAPLPLGLKDLPPIDAVIISHDHYDHLDKATIKFLGNKPKYFVPLKLLTWFNDLDITNVVEMDWWDSAVFDSIRFIEVPAQHFSGRAPFEFNKTLWAGWLIETAKGKIYFAGDTGYSPHFREIAQKVGKIKVVLMPIGAYRPRWFMKTMHMDPPDAVQCFIDLDAEYAIGMHWGTFKQSDEPLAEPPVYLDMETRSNGIKEGRIITLRFGETKEF
jgi:N-acyl-phosphatidylethanolamine-hydrolysing phospholipase D